MGVPTSRGAPGALLTECNEFLAARKGRDQPQTGVDAGRHHADPRRQQFSLGMDQEVLVQQRLPYPPRNHTILHDATTTHSAGSPAKRTSWHTHSPGISDCGTKTSHGSLS